MENHSSGLENKFEALFRLQIRISCKMQNNDFGQEYGQKTQNTISKNVDVEQSKLRASEIESHFSADFFCYSHLCTK